MSQTTQIRRKKEYIKYLLTSRSGASLISVKSFNKKIHSKVWDDFSSIKFTMSEDELIEKDIGFKKVLIGDETNLISSNFVACNTCLSPFLHEVNVQGTSPLSYHVRICNQNLSIQCEKIHSFTELKKKKLILSDTHKMYDSVVEFICKGLRPYLIINDDSFRDLIQTAISIGAKYGNVDVNQTLKRRDYYRDKMFSKYFEFVEDIKNQVADLYGISVTSDIWLEPGRYIISLTLHFLDSITHRIRSYTISCEEIEDKKSLDIAVWFMKKQQEFDLVEKRYIAVTDNGSNISSAFKSGFHFTCACHNINLVVSNVLSDRSICSEPELDSLDAEEISFDEGVDEIVATSSIVRPKTHHINLVDLVEKCKILVRYSKKSNMQTKLTHTLKQAIQTRWNSELTMLKSIVESYDEVETILIDRREFDHLLTKRKILNIKAVIEVLEKFDEATKSLSSQTKPTLHMVIIWHDSLVKHCTPVATDHSLIKNLKSCLLKSMREKWTTRLSDFHYLAVFLDPRYKRLSFLPEVERSKKVDMIVEFMMNFLQLEDDDPIAIDQPCSDFEEMQDDLFVVSMDEFRSESLEDKARKIINTYKVSNINYKLSDYYTDDKFNLLKFWDRSKNEFKDLFRLASWVLTCPASSVPSEQTFSKAGYLVNPRRSRLASNHINIMIALQSFYSIQSTKRIE